MHARMHMRVHAKLAYTPTYEHAPTHTLCLSVPPPPPFSDARILSLTHTHTQTHTHNTLGQARLEGLHRQLCETTGGGREQEGWAWELLEAGTWKEHFAFWREHLQVVRDAAKDRTDSNAVRAERQGEKESADWEGGCETPGLCPGQGSVSAAPLGPAISEVDSSRPSAMRPEPDSEGEVEAGMVGTGAAEGWAVPLVYLFLGTDQVPRYVELSVAQAARQHSGETVLIVSEAALGRSTATGGALHAWAAQHSVTVVTAESIPASRHRAAFERESPLDRRMRGGLWYLSALRLFLIEDFMTATNRSDVLSAECDCLLYTDLGALAPQWRARYRGRVVVGPVTPCHVTGCVMYVGATTALRRVNRFIAECLKADVKYLAQDVFYGHHVNEMVLLAAFASVHAQVSLIPNV